MILIVCAICTINNKFQKQYTVQVAAQRLHKLANAKGDGTGAIVLHLHDWKSVFLWNFALEKHGWAFIKDVIVANKEGARQMGPSAQSVMPAACDHFYVWQLTGFMAPGKFRNNFMWYANTGKKKKNTGQKKKKKTPKNDGDNEAEKEAMEIGDPPSGEDPDWQEEKTEKKEIKPKLESPKQFWSDHFILDKSDFEVSKKERRIFERVMDDQNDCVILARL
jgi:hypothetical protein